MAVWYCGIHDAVSMTTREASGFAQVLAQSLQSVAAGRLTSRTGHHLGPVQPGGISSLPGG